jgi:checkpoint serine/threonine-protein kinase
MKIPALQLIDFGAAIDMDWYKNETFNYVVKTENFTCCEMRENKPWTYQTDLFGLAGTAFVMLFGKYMEVEKRLQIWSVKAKFPRYFNKTLWEHFFMTLLNVESCNAMPNLQELKTQFEEEIYEKEKSVRDKINEFNLALQI